MLWTVHDLTPLTASFFPKALTSGTAAASAELPGVGTEAQASMAHTSSHLHCLASSSQDEMPQHRARNLPSGAGVNGLDDASLKLHSSTAEHLLVAHA